MRRKNITIIGAGKMATILSRYFSNAGHNVYIGAREMTKATQLAEKIGNGVESHSIKESIQLGDIIFLAVPYLQIKDTINLTGPLSGKIVVDMSNPFKPDFSGLLVGGNTSAAEELAKILPEAHIVKAFNTVFATVLDRGPDYQNNCAQVFFAGDDESAKQEIAELIEATGFEPIDTGKLLSARFLEPLSALLIQTDNHLKDPVQITAAMLARPSVPQ